MKKQAREIQFFLFSQYFSDGLRITLGVLLPSLLFAQLGRFEIGLILSLGALCVSITDSPGPVVHKRNAMLLCNVAIFMVAFITGFARLNPYVLGAEIVLFCFGFSMLMVYGARATALGTAGLVVMILTMDNALKPSEILGYSALITAGGVWYMLLSLFFFQIMPYRQAQQTLGECIHEVARFLRYKAEFYRAYTNLDDEYRRIVAQQIVVSEKQDAVREVLFKSRQYIKASTTPGRILLLTFVDLIDLYEQIMATHYDYAALRNKFGKTGVLSEVARLILQIADQLDDIGFAFQSNIRLRLPSNLNPQLEQLKLHIDKVGEDEKETSNLALKKILVNLRNLTHRLHDMQQYFNATPSDLEKKTGPLEYSRFVSQQAYDLKLIRNNLNFNSTIFKHSVRVALVCLFGYIVTKVAPYGQHSYWVLLTIIVILKPGFSLTKQRNNERIIGTIAGSAIGILILVFIPNQTAQFIFLLLCMVGTYSFQRMNYVVSVIFMTPFVLILFNFLGAGNLNIAQERIIDTLIGAAIAFSASYFLFPSWESEQLKKFMREMLTANVNYLQKLSDILAGKKVGIEDYKLARKNVYVHSANLSAAFQRMMSEPKRKQIKSKEVHKFVVLNHILSSFIATAASGLLNRKPQVYPPEYVKPVKRSCAMLTESAKKMEASVMTSHVSKPAEESELTSTLPENFDEHLLKSQLDFIQKVSADIRKISDAILS
ncbi:FUSC family protein [Adhaeribacter sp. BT258]|uniref:FUSC family protein n=1 Tax=Adhaeribacter terrigena TaxID=2793070 RepID=A0ABS1BZX6_9BACT|nr:FUSC family membrane protein [Adhaeribacter terrigena]MBK0402471.1 FUSC family protein [Adhaeribacter terrigena]